MLQFPYFYKTLRWLQYMFTYDGLMRNNVRGRCPYINVLLPDFLDDIKNEETAK
jgi:hypothetical protein